MVTGLKSYTSLGFSYRRSVQPVKHPHNKMAYNSNDQQIPSTEDKKKPYFQMFVSLLLSCLNNFIFKNVGILYLKIRLNNEFI